MWKGILEILTSQLIWLSTQWCVIQNPEFCDFFFLILKADG